MSERRMIFNYNPNRTMCECCDKTVGEHGYHLVHSIVANHVCGECATQFHDLMFSHPLRIPPVIEIIDSDDETVITMRLGKISATSENRRNG
jgi:hypothetical protein